MLLPTVLPYVGTKRHIAGILMDSIAKSSIYIEPFAGSFSCGFELLDMGIIDTAILADADADVINYWTCLRRNHIALETRINQLVDDFCWCNDYNAVINSCISDFDKAAFYYIARKVIWGKKPNFSDASVASIRLYFKKIPTNAFRRHSELLNKHIELINCDYKSFNNVPTYCFMYLDPPYYRVANSALYTVCNEQTFNHSQLRLFCGNLNIPWAMSYDNCSEIAEMYKEYNRYLVYTHDNRRATFELLLSNQEVSLGVIPYTGGGYYA